ncbi:MAG: DUF58 domain-containing protein [bacterium]|nr:DUF58 domain-containing protein [bacterium]
MPTLHGWAALGAAFALGVLWIGFGERLLLALAIFLVGSVAFGVLYVRSSAPRARLTRKISPVQVHDGERAIVQLSLVSSRRLHSAIVEDIVHSLGTASFVAERVDESEPMLARYEVLCKPRGVYKVGPATLRVRDAMALAESLSSGRRADRLVVYPSVEPLAGLPVVRGQDPNVNSARANFSHSGGDDFFTLREYQRGDDLRRVHWPSSARRDELMIKQLEMPWQSRALVLLDIRADSYATPDSFEHAVRGAASAMRHLYRHGFSPTLWSGHSRGTAVTTSQAYELAMEELATVQTNPELDFGALMSRLRREGLAGGALVMVTGVLDSGGVSVFKTLSRDYYKTIVMTVSERENEALHQVKRAGAVAVASGPASKWAPAWREAMEKTWSTASAG